MENKTYEAPPHLQKMFTELLSIKSYVKSRYEDTNDETLKTIYDRLDKIIKDGKERDTYFY